MGDESPRVTGQALYTRIAARKKKKKQARSCPLEPLLIGLLRLVDEQQRHNGEPAVASSSVRAGETQWAKKLLARKSKPSSFTHTTTPSTAVTKLSLRTTISALAVENDSSHLAHPLPSSGPQLDVGCGMSHHLSVFARC